MFKGFTEKTPEFLLELAFNNERPWFAAHRDEFEEHVNGPMKALMRETVDSLNERYPDVGFEGHLSRIYRDARRLFGRGPFKDHLWMSVNSADVGRHGPVFWFEISPRGCSYGAAWYEISPAGMAGFRSAIDANPARFARIAEDIAKIDGIWLYGEEYARPKGDLGETINPWYNRKSVGCGRERGFEGDMLSPELPEILAGEYARFMPLYDFLRELYRTVGDPVREER